MDISSKTIHFPIRMGCRQRRKKKNSMQKKIKNHKLKLSRKVQLELVYIKPGTFIMGDSNYGRHQVTLTKGFWMGKYEVTRAQYREVMKCNHPFFERADLPMVQVSWDEAKAFCAKLTEIEKEVGSLPEGYEYTLPTEAQWEYACQAGITSDQNSDTDISDWDKYVEMLDDGWYCVGTGVMPQRVGREEPNAWGLYDMHENVWEWCLDWDGDYPTTAVIDPVGPATGSRRVLRGCDWKQTENGLRQGYRDSHDPSDRCNTIGFRVVLTLV